MTVESLAHWAAQTLMGCPTMTKSTNRHLMTTTRLTTNEAKCAIYDLADDYSWETVAREMIARMSGDEAREFVADFKRLYDA